MIFYKMETLLTDSEFVEKFQDRRSAAGRTHVIGMKTEEYNKKFKGGSVFVTEIYDEVLTACMVVQTPKDIKKLTNAFCQHINVEIDEDISVEEITIMDFRNQAERASRNGFIRDEDEILDEYNLNRLNGRGFRSVDFGENMLKDGITREEIAKVAEKNLVPSLLPEIDRIYQGKVMQKVKGNPVHYILRASSREIRNTTYKALLSALYDNKRLDCKRYSYLDFRPGSMGISEMTYDALYKTSFGGVIVIRYFGGDKSDDDDYACTEEETLKMIADMLRRYRNDVLSIVCFEREAIKARDSLLEYLGGISMVEIEEEQVSGERAHNYLRTIAKTRHVKADIKLLNKIEDNKLYLSDELRELFDTWYDEKLKTDVFPQYKGCVTARYEAAKQKPKGSAYDELHEMIGLTEAKAMIEKICNFHKMRTLFADKGINMDRPSLHCVFTGPPGTCKTTFARIYARILKENNILSKGHLIEVNGNELKGKYVGWTSKIVEEKVAEAKGGVLFIDEAYSLVDDRSGSFGDEAINSLNALLDNVREECAIVFAGYEDKMTEFLDRNPGLRSRLAFHVPFRNYTTDELLQIADHMCKHKGIKLSEDAREKLTGIFNEARNFEDFGNGRFVRTTIIENSLMNQAGRILRMDVDKVTEEDLRTITAEDIEPPAVNHDTKIIKNIGFCA